MNPKLEVHNLRSEKIQPTHLDRLAVVYVRQSWFYLILLRLQLDCYPRRIRP
jgi:hypothetical protein